MEKKLKNKTLWMRNVDFKMLMDFAYFVFMHSNQYRPRQLEYEATRAGLFSRDEILARWNDVTVAKHADAVYERLKGFFKSV